MTKIQPIDKRKDSTSSNKLPELPISPTLEDVVRATTSTISAEVKARLKAAVKKEVDEGYESYQICAIPRSVKVQYPLDPLV